MEALPENGFIHEAVNGELVMSPTPNNTRVEIDERLRDFFASGTRLAWIVDPEAESVEACHSPTQRRLIGSGGFLEGEQLLPGFRHPISDLFKDWDWD